MKSYEAMFWLMCTLCVVLILAKLGNVCVEGFAEMDRERVIELHGVLTPEECNSLIEFARSNNMTASEVLDKNNKAGTGVNYNNRKSKQLWMDYNTHPVAQKLSELSVQLTGYPQSNQEKLQVAMYEEGGEFKAHHDACSDADNAYCDRMNNGAGQRRTTILVYLNDAFDGGETVFVNQGRTIIPKTGNAIMFWDTREDDTIIDATQHQAMPVLNGNKWIATVWSHPKAYNNT